MVTKKSTVFWDVVLYSHVEIYLYFGGTYTSIFSGEALSSLGRILYTNPQTGRALSQEN
jgi:hypothetical protein